MVRFEVHLENVETNDFAQKTVQFLSDYVPSAKAIHVGVGVDALDVMQLTLLGIWENAVIVFEIPSLDMRSKNKLNRFFTQYGKVVFYD